MCLQLLARKRIEWEGGAGRPKLHLARSEKYTFRILEIQITKKGKYGLQRLRNTPYRKAPWPERELSGKEGLGDPNYIWQDLRNTLLES